MIWAWNLLQKPGSASLGWASGIAVVVVVVCQLKVGQCDSRAHGGHRRMGLAWAGWVVEVGGVAVEVGGVAVEVGGVSSGMVGTKSTRVRLAK